MHFLATFISTVFSAILLYTTIFRFNNVYGATSNVNANSSFDEHENKSILLKRTENSFDVQPKRLALVSTSAAEGYNFIINNQRSPRSKRGGKKCHYGQQIVRDHCIYHTLLYKYIYRYKKIYPEDDVHEAVHQFVLHPPPELNVIHIWKITITDLEHVPRQNYFTMKAYIDMKWNDTRLKWNLKEFHMKGEQDNHFDLTKGDNIWYPPFKGKEGIGADLRDSFFDLSSVRIKHNGLVKATVYMHSYAKDLCSVDYRNFPSPICICCQKLFNDHDPDLTILNYRVKEDSDIKVKLSSHRGLKLLKAYYRKELTVKKRHKYEFYFCVELQVQNNIRELAFVGPSVVVLVITFLSPCFQCLRTQKGVTLVALSVLLGWYIVLALESTNVPFGGQVPRVYVHYYFSVALVLTSLIITTVLERLSLRSFRTGPPQWLLKSSRMCYFLCWNEEPTQLLGETSFSVDHGNGETVDEGPKETCQLGKIAPSLSDWGKVWYTSNIIVMILLAVIYFIGLLSIFA